MTGMLDQLEDLAEALSSVVERNVVREIELVAGNMYCPQCLDYMRMNIKLLTRRSGLINDIIDFYRLRGVTAPAQQRFPVLGRLFGKIFSKRPNPRFASTEPATLLLYSCVQCKNRFNVVVHQDEDGPTIAVLPSFHGGLSTPNTPPTVAYYVDQANKACSVKANGAAIAMFRAALDQLLEEQGFAQASLPLKLRGLEAAIQKGTAPDWVKYISTDLLTVIKELGDSGMHPNEISKLREYDDTLSVRSQIAFATVLNAVYEHSTANRQLLSQLNAVLANL